MDNFKGNNLSILNIKDHLKTNININKISTLIKIKSINKEAIIFGALINQIKLIYSRLFGLHMRIWLINWWNKPIYKKELSWLCNIIPVCSRMYYLFGQWQKSPECWLELPTALQDQLSTSTYYLLPQATKYLEKEYCLPDLTKLQK